MFKSIRKWLWIGLRGFFMFLGFCVLTVAIKELIHPTPSFGLYRIEAIDDASVYVSRYIAKKPDILTSEIWKNGFDPDYVFISYDRTFYSSEIKGKIGGYIVWDSQPANSSQEHLRYLPPEKFDEAREQWEEYRRFKNVE